MNDVSLVLHSSNVFDSHAWCTHHRVNVPMWNLIGNRTSRSFVQHNCDFLLITLSKRWIARLSV